MKTEKELNNILNECLEHLLVRGRTIEQCLAYYPEHAMELEPLLRTAVAIKSASAIEPRPEFRSRARYQFQLALSEAKFQKRLPFFSQQPRWAIAVVTMLIILLGAGGTVAAAGNSMPDSFLYPVKLATEEVRLKLTASDMGKAELYAELADRRVAEIVYVVDKGESDLVQDIGQRLSSSVLAIASLTSAEMGERAFSTVKPAEPPPSPVPSVLEKSDVGVTGGQGESDERTKLRTILERFLVDHPAALNAALEEAPESIKPTLQEIIAEITTDYEKVLQALN